ncbi:MAG: mechanosensitive ion channel, partial [Phycisphaeraceae bacterium]|nr:mechanosensitive ion channel [Phycisphaeraceae bacterium]
TNWTYSNTRARVEVDVGVAYSSDVALAQRLMLDAAREHPKCLKHDEIKCWLIQFADSAVNLRLVFWIPDIRDGRLGPKSEVMLAILGKFKANGIEIPYPQRVVQFRQAEPERA